MLNNTGVNDNKHPLSIKLKNYDSLDTEMWYSRKQEIMSVFECLISEIKNGNDSIKQVLMDNIDFLSDYERDENVAPDFLEWFSGVNFDIGSCYLKSKDYQSSGFFLLKCKNVLDRLNTNQKDDVLEIQCKTYERLAIVSQKTEKKSEEFFYLKEATKLYETLEQQHQDYNSHLTELLFLLFKKVQENDSTDKKDVKRRLIKRLKKNKRKHEDCRNIYADISIRGNIYKFYYTHTVMRRFLCIFVLIFGTLSVVNIAFQLRTNNNLLTAIALYLHDGSSVIDNYEEARIDNELYTIGNDLYRGGYYDDAIFYLNEAYREMKTDYSDDTVEMAEVQLRLGACYAMTGSYKMAYDHLMNAYISFKNNYGEDNDITNEAKIDLAIANFYSSNFESALKDASKTFEDFHYFGRKITSSLMISKCLRETGHLDTALTWANKSLKYFDCLYTINLDSTVFLERAECYSVVGSIYYQKQEYENARHYYSLALEDDNKAIKSTNDSNKKKRGIRALLTRYTNLALIEDAESNEKEKIAYYKKALSIAEENDFDEYVLYISSEIAVYENDGTSLSTINDNLNACIAKFGEISQQTLRHLWLISNYYFKIENYNQSKTYAMQALSVQKALLADNNSFTVSIYQQLITTSLKLGDYKSICEFGADGLALSARIHGTYHQMTLLQLNALAKSYYELGQYSISLALSRLGYNICESIDTNQVYSFSQYIGKSYEKISNKQKVQELYDLTDKYYSELDGSNIGDIFNQILKECT